jgi:hypothetical protein
MLNPLARLLLSLAERGEGRKQRPPGAAEELNQRAAEPPMLA